MLKLRDLLRCSYVVENINDVLILTDELHKYLESEHYKFVEQKSMFKETNSSN